jgi:putative flippase GtrA
VKALVSHPVFSHTLFRFLIAGGVNTLFGLTVYSAFALIHALPTWVVLVITTVLGIIFNFLTTGGLVFRDMGLARIPRFVLCYAVMTPLYAVLIDRLAPFTGGRICAMAIVVIPMTVLNYLLQSRFVFRKPAPAQVEPLS